MAVHTGKAMLSYAIEAGEELLAVKKELPHGEFQKWCVESLTFGVRLAQRYMCLAKTSRVTYFDADASIRGALEAAGSPVQGKPKTLDTSTAQRLLKLSAMASGGNEHEELVAQEMLDKLATRAEATVASQG